jgi:hypothetical protein
MFLVVWQPAATDDLAVVCVDHPDRWNDIDAAENDIDYKLRKDPLHSVNQSPKDCGASCPNPWQFISP